MNEQELRGSLQNIIAEIIEVEQFGADEDFVNDLGVDSMMALEIVARIEKSFHIRIPEKYLPEIRSLNEVVRVVQEVLQPVNP